MEPLLLPPVHALGNGILMGAGEGSKNQGTGIGGPLVDVHPGAALVDFHNGGKVGEVQLGIHAVGVHIHGQGDHIHIAGPLAVSEEGTLHPVGSCQQSQLRIRHAGAPVVVGVQGHGNVLPILQVLAHVLHLAGVDMGQAHLHSHGQVDNDVVVFAGLQHIQHGIAHFQCVLRLGAREALGRILEAEVPFILGGQLLHQLGPLHGDLLDLFLALFENLLPLGHRGRVIEVDNGTGGTLAGLEGLADDVLPALGQHLDRHVLGDHVLLDQSPQEGVFRLRGGGESHLDLLEAHF